MMALWMTAVGLASPLPAMSGALPCTASNTAARSRQYSRTRDDAEASDQSGAEIAQDVAVEILGDDDVELVRRADHLHHAHASTIISAGSMLG